MKYRTSWYVGQGFILFLKIEVGFCFPYQSLGNGSYSANGNSRTGARRKPYAGHLSGVSKSHSVRDCTEIGPRSVWSRDSKRSTTEYRKSGDSKTESDSS